MQDNTDPPPRPPRLGQALLLGLLLVFGIPMGAGLYVDFRWYSALGHVDIFSTVLGTKLALGVSIGLVVGLLLFANLRLALRNSKGLSPLYLHDPDGMPRVNLGESAIRVVVPASVVIGLLTGLVNHRHWSTWLLSIHGGEFGSQDAVFQRDIGFYVFQLPMWETTSSLALWALGVSTFGAAAMYAMRGGISVSETGSHFHPPAKAHLSVLVALILANLAFEAYLDIFRILYSEVGPTMGASYADVNAKLPALRIKVAVAGMGALLVLASIGRENFYLALAAGALYILAQFGVQAYPSMVHRFSVVPNEYEREGPYIKNNIDATRAAYGLDNVEERELAGENTLGRADIDKNRSTLDNIRLWDHQPLLDTFAQIQEIRTYYDFASVDNDRYVINGELRQTMLSPRELSSSSLPNRTWINERLKFTHGYGLTLGPVNEATPEGLPVLMVQDIPPNSMSPNIQIKRPAIYFGELSNDHVFVRTRNREFHYPSGEGYVETDYDGAAGVRFDSGLTRFALAIKLGSLKLLLSNDIDSDSRALLYRNITDRVQRVAPFLYLDPDPYMVVREDGTLTWVYDAYTMTNRYPYSEGSERLRINYIRNSAKVTIDAYDGDVTLYAADETDPLLKAWRRIFPQTFQPLSEMPADLRAHLRYPELIFKIQTEMFTLYHMRESQLLYSREDQWQIPSIKLSEGKQQMEPYYTVMKLPGSEEPEFIQMLPFTPKRKDNLAAWMVARADGDHYGELVIYRFPKDRLVFGPQQVVNRINQDAEISRQISLWDQRGSDVLLGTLLVIPIEESLIYVRPLYIRSEGGKIPELKRVIVAYEKAIAMKPSLREAVDALFPPAGSPAAARAEGPEPAGAEAGAAPAAAPAIDTASGEGPIEVRALEHFQRAIRAQRAGEWAAYGDELERVEALLRRMQPAATPQAPAATEATEGPSEPAPQPMGTAPAPAAPAPEPAPRAPAEAPSTP